MIATADTGQRLYHHRIGFPANFTAPNREIRVQYGPHPRYAAFNRWGIPRLPDTLDLSQFQVIEIAMTGNKLDKIVVRSEYNRWDDIIFVLMPLGDGYWRCKTVWLNAKNDNHRKLDRSKYSHP